MAAIYRYRKKKLGPAIYLALDGKARDVVRDIDKTKLASDTGADEIIKILENTFLKDENTRAYLAFKSFYNFRRTAGMTIVELITMYEKLYSEMKKFDMKLPEAVAAFMLLNAVNISEENERLARATLSKITYDEMKSKIMRIFAESGEDDEKAPEIKLEISDVYNSRSGNNSNNRGNHGRSNRGKGRGSYRGGQAYRGNQEERSSSDGGGKECYICKSKEHLSFQCPKNENRLRCFTCNSPDHMANNCPNRASGREEAEEQVNYTLYTIREEQVFTGEHSMNTEVTSTKFNTMVKDTLGMALLDSGCTKTVVGKIWLSTYLEMIDDEDMKKVTQVDDCSTFRFGDGNKVVSYKMVKIPATIGTKNVTIEASVVDNDIPLLLSRNSMKKANMIVDFNTDKAVLFGEEVSLHSTKCGHYCLPLLSRVRCQLSPRSNFVLHVSDDFKKLSRKEKKQKAVKLHQ